MIDYIKGNIEEITPASVTLENNGVGYFLHISLNTYSAINGKPNGKLYVYEAIREDAYLLFGFFDKHERQLFMQLISVSGIGAGTARMILSSMSPVELANVIASSNADALKNVKGIGLKTAQRVIVDLKDKIKLSGEVSQMVVSGNTELSEESVAALVMLGFQQAASQKAVSKILKDSPNSTIEQVIKQALKML
ncbi:MAG: Holliday junction branch migration protein RuvA [Dysgonomonas sp.]